MSALRARVRDGHLVIDEPTDFPEGTEVQLIAIDSDDALSDEQRVVLHAALDAGLSDLEANRRVEADVLIARISRA